MVLRRESLGRELRVWKADLGGDMVAEDGVDADELPMPRVGALTTIHVTMHYRGPATIYKVFCWHSLVYGHKYDLSKTTEI